MNKVGFIGLGVMGAPMCANLARKSGATVTAYDVRPEPLEKLAEEVGLNLRGAETARGLLEESSAAGYADVYFPALLNIVDAGSGEKD